MNDIPRKSSNLRRNNTKIKILEVILKDYLRLVKDFIDFIKLWNRETTFKSNEKKIKPTKLIF